MPGNLLSMFFRGLTTLLMMLDRDERSAYDEATALPPIVYRDSAHMPDRKTARERFDLCFAARVDHADFERRQCLGQKVKDRFNTDPMQYRVLVRPMSKLGELQDEVKRLTAKGYNATLYYSCGGWVKNENPDLLRAMRDTYRDTIRHPGVIPFKKRNPQ
jgi:hypothetical protein